MLNRNFWQGRRVLLTGHTGFKGAWISLFLEELGAQVFGISLSPPTQPNLYEILSPWPNLTSTIHDIRDLDMLAEVVDQVDPECVIHMAAQSLVRESYIHPLNTFETNVMGTVHLLESLKQAPHLMAALVITTDKVYLNSHGQPHRETDPLGGNDCYSASKAAAEIVVSSYASRMPVYTARSGNAIGGGDWAKDRIIPDLWRASISGQAIQLRYPHAVRPWQHVLDPLYGYLLYLEAIASANKNLPRALNFGPPLDPMRTVAELAELFCKASDHPQLYILGEPNPQFQEQPFLTLNATLAQKTLGWKCTLNVDEAVAWTGQWYKALEDKLDLRQFSKEQITHYLELINRDADSPLCQTQVV